jgi:hypothetical protein
MKPKTPYENKQLKSKLVNLNVYQKSFQIGGAAQALE